MGVQSLRWKSCLQSEALARLEIVMRRDGSNASHKVKYDEFRSRHGMGAESPSSHRPNKMSGTGPGHEVRTGFSPRHANQQTFSPRHPAVGELHQGPPAGYRGPHNSNQGYPMPYAGGINDGFGRPSPRAHQPLQSQYMGHEMNSRGPGMSAQSPRADMGPGGQSPRTHRSDAADDLPRLPPIMLQLFAEEDSIQNELKNLHQARMQLTTSSVTCKLNTDHAKALEALAAQEMLLVSQQLSESEIRMNETMGR